MQFFTATLFALASASLTLAQSMPNPFNNPPGGYQTSAGSTANISWTPTTQGTVTLYLRSGDSAYLNNGTAIASSIPNSGQYTYHVPSDILRGSSYTYEIVDDADTSLVNYTPQFIIDSTNLYSSTFGVSSGVAVSTASASASTTGSAATTTSSGASAASSGSSASTASSGTASTTSSAANTSASPLTQSKTGGAGPRATAAAGMLGVIALGALAL